MKGLLVMGYFKCCASEIAAWLRVDNHLIRPFISNVMPLCLFTKIKGVGQPFIYLFSCLHKVTENPDVTLKLTLF